MAAQDSAIYISDEELSLDESSARINESSFSMRYTTAVGEFSGITTIQNWTSEQAEVTVVQREEDDVTVKERPLDLTKVKDEGIDDSLAEKKNDERSRPPKPPRPSLVMTPQRKHVIREELAAKYYSPEYRGIPEIIIVPPSVERKRLFWMDTTPARPTKVLISANRISKGIRGPSTDQSVGGGAGPTKPIFSFSGPSATTATLVTSKSDKIRIKAEKNRSISHRGSVTPDGPSCSLRAGAKGGRNKHSPLLSPRNRTIGKKSPAGSEKKYSAQKIQAIMLDLGVVKVNGSGFGIDVGTGVGGGAGGGVATTPTILSRGMGTFNVTPKTITPRQRISFRDNSTPKSATPTLRPVGKSTPFHQVKVEPISPVLSIRGVRLNRQFELLMKFRNNLNGH